MSRVCGYCQAEIPYDITRSKDWNDSVGRKFCDRDCYYKFRSVSKVSTYMRMSLVCGGFSVKSVYDLMIEDVNMKLSVFSEGHLRKGLNPKRGYDNILIAISLGRALYKLDSVYFSEFEFDYRLCFSFGMGSFIEGGRAPLHYIGDGLNMPALLMEWKRAFTGGTRGKEYVLGDRVYRILKKRLQDKDIEPMYKENFVECFWRESKRDRYLIDSKVAYALGEVMLMLGQKVDYRCLMPKISKSKYGLNIMGEILKFK